MCVRNFLEEHSTKNKSSLKDVLSVCNVRTMCVSPGLVRNTSGINYILRHVNPFLLLSAEAESEEERDRERDALMASFESGHSYVAGGGNVSYSITC